MRRLSTALSGAALLTCLLPSATAELLNATPPAFRGLPSTEFSGWDVFTSASAGANLPDTPGSSSDDASLIQNVPGAILTGTGNIYHPSATPTYTITDSVPADLQEVVLHVRSLGNPLNTAAPGPVLRYTPPSGPELSLAYDEYELISSTPGMGVDEEHRFTWKLAPVAHAIFAYAIDFEGSSSNVSLEAVWLDARFHLGERTCSPGVPNSSGQPGVMLVTGSDNLSDNDLTLTAIQLPTGSNIGYFLMGTGGNTFTPPGSAGPICIAPGLKRYLPPVSNTNELPGGFSRTVGTHGPVSGQLTSGSTWGFQAWHRDALAGTSNLTDAVVVSFQ